MPLVSRDSNSDSDSLSTTNSNGVMYIVVIAVCGVVVAGLAVWFLVHRLRRRAEERDDALHDATFLRVKGVYRENEKEPLPENLQALHGTTFSRNQLTDAVVLPDKVLTRPQTTRDEIFEYHAQSGNLPKPFTFALSAGSAPAPLGPDRGSWIRHSTASSHRFSVISSTSSIESSTSTVGRIRKVLQPFDNPILPDELLVGAGERLTTVSAFDDGWVLVSREQSPFASAPKSLFATPGPPSATNVELGVVPAWIFIKPVKGLRTERPMRSSSLGITVQMDSPQPAFASRQQVLSWSNF
ncbi:hypothetical protein HMN09_00433800 [Mycena chlorophos]|uniref:SH3 domain-containing protein n=1 Tax=Mycena chlorophos TaxID=658473 RepID=A0A8H6WFP5_MYCCL|nr:hypothetical protein HMN09_00433800 [Mycena chlorophos]